MGQWTLERLTTHSTPLNGQVFGTNYHAIFHLRYKTSSFGSYTETPRLDWHETIMMNEHHNRKAWVFDTNMYAHNPTSNTLVVWAERYIEAYLYATNQPPHAPKGNVQLNTLLGQRVTAQALGGTSNDGAERADIVRSYLKRHGGVFIIEIHDIPGINTPTGAEHKERLLLFNVGVEGGSLRSRAEQYLNVLGGKPVNTWQREFVNDGWRRARLNTTGLTVGPPPPLVANPRQPTFMAGECW